MVTIRKPVAAREFRIEAVEALGWDAQDLIRKEASIDYKP